MKAVLELEPATASLRTACDSTMFRVAFCLVSIVMIAPLLVIDTPLLADYPNHVARMHVLGNVDNIPLLSERYEIGLDLIPNIAMDLVIPWLMQVMPLDLAARFFLAACLVSTLAGVAWLHQTLFNQWSLYPLLAALFAYHGSLMAGMVNFSLGIALVPAALALWIRVRQAAPAWRILIGSAVALLLYFCHLVAVGGYSLLLIGYELGLARELWGKMGGRRRIARDLTIAGVTGLLPALLFLRLAVGESDASPASGLVFGNAAWKAKALLAPLANYNLPLDLLSLVLIGGLALILWQAGWLKVERRMVLGLAILAATFLLAPKALWTGGVFDQRLSTLLALMLVACTCFEAPKSHVGRLLAAALALLFLVRMAVLTSAWVDHRDDLAEMRQAIEMVEPGSRLLVTRPDVATAYRLAPPRHRVFHHAIQLPSLPTLAVIEKSAFVSTLYALPGQQPLSLKPPFDRLGGRGHADLPTLADLARSSRWDGSDPAPHPQIQDWQADFDYVVLIYGYGPGAEALAGDLPLEPLLDGEILDLFRIIKG